MSGHKRATISITQEEYQRLLDVELQLRAQGETAVFAFQPPEEVIRGTQEALDQNLQFMRAREAQFDSVIATYHGELQRVEAAANHALAVQQQQLMQHMQQLAGELWANSEALLSQARREYQQQLAAVEHRLVEEIRLVNERLDANAAHDEARLGIAAHWLQACNDLCAFIDAEYRHNFYLPGELDRLAGEIYLAGQNLESGLPEASVASAQQAFLRLTRLRARLEQAETEWIVLNQACTEAVNMVYAEIDASREIEAIDIDGRPIPFQLDVDYWTRGAWSALADEFIQTIQDLRLTDPPPANEYLQELLGDYLPGVRSRLTELCFAARVEALNSQLRVNIADLVIQALSVQGFRLEAFQYNQDDWRAPFEAHLTSPDHSQVTVQVNPFGPNLGANELHIISDDHLFRSQRELRQRWAEVQGSLVGAGLLVNEVETMEHQRRSERSRAANQRAIRLKSP